MIMLKISDSCVDTIHVLPAYKLASDLFSPKWNQVERLLLTVKADSLPTCNIVIVVCCKGFFKFLCPPYLVDSDPQSVNYSNIASEPWSSEWIRSDRASPQWRCSRGGAVSRLFSRLAGQQQRWRCKSRPAITRCCCLHVFHSWPLPPPFHQLWPSRLGAVLSPTQYQGWRRCSHLLHQLGCFFFRHGQ